MTTLMLLSHHVLEHVILDVTAANVLQIFYYVLNYLQGKFRHIQSDHLQCHENLIPVHALA